MSMTYAGYALTLPNDAFLPILERWWDDTAPELWSFPGYNLEELHYLPVPDRPKQQKAKLNTLYWPSDASRWGIFHSLMDGSTLDSVQAIVGGGGSTLIAEDLIISDTVQDKVITASMFLLAARPVFAYETNSSLVGAGQLYWITLVDKRYYGWMKNLAYTYSPGDSWATLIQNLSTAAGLPSPTVSTISADYSVPDDTRWEGVQRPLPLLLDAACKQVGLRFVIALDGATTKALNYADATVIDEANYTNNADHIYSGGRNTLRNIIGSVPANVVVSFWGDPPGIETVTLATLALSQYSGLSGVSGAYGFVGVDQSDADTSPAHATVATRAATDYYLWLLSLNDVVFRSVRELTLSGLEDHFEWEYVGVHRGRLAEKKSYQASAYEQPVRIKTRIVPLNWSDKNVYGFAAPDVSSVSLIPPFVKITNTSSYYSWQGRKVSSTVAWANSTSTGSSNALPVEIDNLLFQPQPTTPGLVFPDETGTKYGLLPMQIATKVSSTYYMGFVGIGNETWRGVKTMDGGLIVQALGGVGGGTGTFEGTVTTNSAHGSNDFVVQDSGGAATQFFVDTSARTVTIGSPWTTYGTNNLYVDGGVWASQFFVVDPLSPTNYTGIACTHTGGAGRWLDFDSQIKFLTGPGVAVSIVIDSGNFAYYWCSDGTGLRQGQHTTVMGMKFAGGIMWDASGAGGVSGSFP